MPEDFVLQALERYVAQMARSAGAQDATYHTGLRYAACLIQYLRSLSGLLTLFLHLQPQTFWTVARHTQLDDYALFMTPDEHPAEYAAAAKTASFTYWNSMELEPMYWPFVLRMMFSGKSMFGHSPRRALTYSALSFRLHTVGPVAFRARQLLEALTHAHASIRANPTAQLALLQLNGFLRWYGSQYRDPASDFDPANLLARSIHGLFFSGHVASLAPEARKRLAVVLRTIKRAHGKDIATSIELAFLQACASGEQALLNVPIATTLHTLPMDAMNAGSVVERAAVSPKEEPGEPATVMVLPPDADVIMVTSGQHILEQMVHAFNAFMALDEEALLRRVLRKRVATMFARDGSVHALAAPSYLFATRQGGKERRRRRRFQKVGTNGRRRQ